MTNPDQTTPTSNNATPSTDQPTIQVTTPLVIDFGRAANSDVQAMKAGKGTLMDDVLEIVDEVADQLHEQAQGRIFMPVVIVIERESRRR